MEPATPASRLFRELDAALDALSLDDLLRSLGGATPLPAAATPRALSAIVHPVR